MNHEPVKSSTPPPPRKRSILGVLYNWATLLLGLAALVGAIAWMSGVFHPKIEPVDAADHDHGSAGEVVEPDAKDRATARVEAIREVERVDAVGTIEPRRKTNVAGQILATILEIKVNAGDAVKRGDPLVTLDDRELQAQSREAAAAISAAEAELSLREQDLARYRKLYADKAVTREDLDRMESTYKVAAAQLRRAREQTSRIDIQLTYTKIRATADGLVLDRFVDPGDLAAPGKPLLTISDPAELELHAGIREGLAGFVHPGLELPVHIDAVGRDLIGKVREIVPQAEPTSRSVLVKIALPSDQTKGLYNGMFGRIAIAIGDRERIVAPRAFIDRVGQLDLALVQGDKRIERRFVRVGSRYGDKIEILSGLKIGETLVADGIKR